MGFCGVEFGKKWSLDKKIQRTARPKGERPKRIQKN